MAAAVVDTSASDDLKDARGITDKEIDYAKEVSSITDREIQYVMANHVTNFKLFGLKDGRTCCSCRLMFPSRELIDCDGCPHFARDRCMGCYIINDDDYWYCPCCAEWMVPPPPPPPPPTPPPGPYPPDPWPDWSKTDEDALPFGDSILASRDALEPNMWALRWAMGTEALSSFVHALFGDGSDGDQEGAEQAPEEQHTGAQKEDKTTHGRNPQLDTSTSADLGTHGKDEIAYVTHQRDDDVGGPQTEHGKCAKITKFIGCLMTTAPDRTESAPSRTAVPISTADPEAKRIEPSRTG